nr:hypothetical protein [Brevundimonas diminuta]
MKRLISFLAAVTISGVVLGGCVSTGTNYDPALIDQIAHGTPVADVIARLGQPNSRTTLPNGQTQLMWLHATGTAWGSADARSAVLLFDADGNFVRVITTNQTSLR